MENQVFSFLEFGFDGVKAQPNCSDKGLQRMEEGKGRKKFNFPGAEDRGSDFGSYKKGASEEGIQLFKYHQEEWQKSFRDCGLFDDQHFASAPPPVQTCLEEIAKLGDIKTLIPEVEPKTEKQQQIPFASLELLKNYENRFRWSGDDKRTRHTHDMSSAEVEGRKLTTEEIMRLAGAKFINNLDVSLNSHPFQASFYGLSDAETKDVILVESLLASAEKVGCEQFDRARRLLNGCLHSSSDTGNPVQRLVYYFANALQEKIDREAGGFTLKDVRKRQSLDVDKAILNVHPTTVAYYEGIPFSQIPKLAGIQAIMESMAEARKIHIIDFAIKSGVQWTVLMQALATRDQCPLEILKITAVGTTSRDQLERRGKWLVSFAQTMNIPFSFKVVFVSDMLDLKEDHFEIDTDEPVAVYCSYFLNTLLTRSNRLENVMRVVTRINPCVMVVAEVEANHNSPSFVCRFIEALFYFCTFFDCLEDLETRRDPNRMILESRFFNEGIRHIVATEGEERKIRHVKLDVWRQFFERYGMEEKELSMSSLYQAKLVIEKLQCENSCTLKMNRNSLIISWKGTPNSSVSVWEFVWQKRKSSRTSWIKMSRMLSFPGHVWVLL